MAVCRTKCIDLTEECLKILDIYHSYNQNLLTEKKIKNNIKYGEGIEDGEN